MPAIAWKPEYTCRAEEIWKEYQRTHDLSGKIGHVAAVDPESGRVWIGESGVGVAEQTTAAGVDAPLYLVRVGYPSYARKGRR